MGYRSGFEIWKGIAKGIVLVSLIVGCMYGALFLLQKLDITENVQQPQTEYSETLYVKRENRLALENFIERHFIDDGFMRTNLVDSVQTDLASGSDVLSESVGLLMLLYIETDEPALFDQQVQILKEHFLKENQLLKWRIRPSESKEIANQTNDRAGERRNASDLVALDDNMMIVDDGTVNATLDDLRIARALLLAADKWKHEQYGVFAQQIAEHLLEYCVVDDQLRAFDDSASPAAPMVYYDFLTMEMLSASNVRWNDIIKANRSRIIESQINGYPFFDDPWFAANVSPSSESKGYPMIENLMVFMHLSEIGEADRQALTWLQEQIRLGGIYANYGSDGKALNSVESPAIYGIVSYIALLHQDEQLYRLVLEKLQTMQNMSQGDYYGGFVDLAQLSAYSFDQLTALLAYSREQDRRQLPN